MLPHVEVYKTGEIGTVMLQACRDGKLSKEGVLEVCRRMAFPREFLALALDYCEEVADT